MYQISPNFSLSPARSSAAPSARYTTLLSATCVRYPWDAERGRGEVPGDDGLIEMIAADTEDKRRNNAENVALVYELVQLVW